MHIPNKEIRSIDIQTINQLIDIQLANVSRETCDLVDRIMLLYKAPLENYAERLIWWNRKVNLISRSMSFDDLMLHIRHSLFAVDFIQKSNLIDWVDTGTGGGLPGIPLSIVLPHKQFVLNDIVEKKGMVLRDLAHHLSLINTQVRVADLLTLDHANRFGVVSKHAFKLNDVLTRLHGKPWNELILLKGADYIEEIPLVSHPIDSATAYSLEHAKPISFFSGKFLLHLCQIESKALVGD